MKRLNLVKSLMAEGPQALEDISGQRRDIRGVLEANSVEDVCAIVRWAAREGGVRLHPISCGNNWGFGSNLPPEDGAFILDLSRLKNIRQLATDRNFAEIEPGVTQGALDSALKAEGRTHYFNVTGAGTDASLIGNALERGIGYFGMRHEDILDLEIVLPTGEVIYTGFHPDNPFHSGLGPNLTGLFFQSAFGIVTAARVRLHKRPDCIGGMLIKPKSATPIERIVESLGVLRAEGLISSVPHIGNRQRAYVTFGPFVPVEQRERLAATLTDWTAVVPLSGSKETVEVVSNHISIRLGSKVECELITKRDDTRGLWIDSLLDLCQGIPSNIALPGVGFAAMGTVDANSSQPGQGDAGLIHAVPTCRPDQEDLELLFKLIEKIRKKHEMSELPMTVNLGNVGMAVVVISVPFPRHQVADRDRALHFADDLKRRCFDQGFFPYRLGVGDSTTHSASLGTNQILEAIQSVVDPKRILCRSKYDALGSKMDKHEIELAPFAHNLELAPEVVEV